MHASRPTTTGPEPSEEDAPHLVTRLSRLHAAWANHELQDRQAEDGDSDDDAGAWDKALDHLEARVRERCIGGWRPKGRNRVRHSLFSRSRAVWSATWRRCCEPETHGKSRRDTPSKRIGPPNGA